MTMEDNRFLKRASEYSLKQHVALGVRLFSELVEIERSKLVVLRAEHKENQMYHKMMQNNTKDISKRLNGLGIALDKLLLTKSGLFDGHSNPSDFMDDLDAKYKAFQKKLRSKERRL